MITWDFHTGDYLASKTHPYQSDPLGWLVMERPVGVDAQNDLAAETCGHAATSSCMREVLLLGNPVLWWTGALALMASVVAWFTTKDWRWGIPILGVAASWLPWFISSGRPIFSFYAVVTIPFTIIAISLVVERPGEGGRDAAPALRAVARRRRAPDGGRRDVLVLPPDLHRRPDQL